MQARGFWTLSDVSDGELQNGLKELLRAGGCTEARIVAHLAEVDARRLHLHGAPSLFQYCLVDLGFSESEAWYRISAARAGRKFPLVFELLEKRELHLTAVALLSKYLTEENHGELLAEARGQTKQQILENLARRWPRADVSSHLRRIPAGAVAAGPTATLEPRSAETYCLQLCASRELKAKLDQARDLLSHVSPSGDLAIVVERALDLLIQKLKAQRFGQTGKREAGNFGQTGKREASSFGQTGKREGGGFGQADEGTADGASQMDQRRADGLCQTDELKARGVEKSAASQKRCADDATSQPRKRRRIRQEVRRRVAERDAERCCHVGPDGRRCEARAFLELHHEWPWALGGADSVDNLRLLCRAHNRLRAELELGAGRVARAIARYRERRR
ncbi:MAG TPA: HNH endonuclease signature motif containing protein [Polyangiaceae bacterium]|nr:HNH endonuclease signature motif containing protein [Polyangiaceae bacterium]